MGILQPIIVSNLGAGSATADSKNGNFPHLCRGFSEYIQYVQVIGIQKERQRSQEALLEVLCVDKEILDTSRRDRSFPCIRLTTRHRVYIASTSLLMSWLGSESKLGGKGKQSW